MSKNREASQRSSFWTSSKILFWVVLLGLVPFVLREFEVEEKLLREIGRGAVGLGLLVMLYGFLKHVARLALALAIALLAFAILVSEGVIDVPRLTG